MSENKEVEKILADIPVMDGELQEKTIQMQEAAIEVEKENMVRHMEKYECTEEESLRLADIEEEIVSAKKTRRNTRLLCGVLFGLCILCLVARLIAA